MKNILFFLLLSTAVCLFSQEITEIPQAASLPVREKNSKEIFPISVEFPYEGMPVPAGVKNTFIFGSISNPKAALTINGAPAQVYKNGGFLAFLPVSPAGEFSFVLQTDDGVNQYSAVRKIKTTGTDVTAFTSAQFDIRSFRPAADVWAAENDTVELAAVGAPGNIVTATIAGVKNAKEITLTEGEPGFYSASYAILANDKAKSAKITYAMYNPRTKQKDKGTAAGKLKILSPKELLFANVIEGGPRIRSKAVAQGSLYPFYRLYGGVIINGLQNGLYRVLLDANNSGWIEENKISLTKKPLPSNQVKTITVSDQGSKTRLIFYGERPVPLLTQGAQGSFSVTFFYTGDNVPDIEEPLSPLVKNIVTEIISDAAIKFQINFHDGQSLWGYDYAFDEHGAFVLDLMHKPVIEPKPLKPLNGAKIMLDPGHSPRRRPPYDGAIGPTGVLEYEVNMQTAKAAAALLEKAGAEVTLSKNEKEELSLQGRAERALKNGAHVFVSIHHNALPVSVNPFTGKRGFTVYYFNEHSKNLADNLTRAFVKNVNLPDGGTQIGDFYVVRAPQFPAVLTENAFLMFPEQEEMVKEEASRQKFAQAIFEGILSFYGASPADLTPPALPKRLPAAPAKKPAARQRK